MSMDYAAFKDYLVTFLWKTGDTVLLDSLDQLILMGTSELSRKLTINAREVLEVIPVTGNVISLPADFKQVVSLNSECHKYRKATESTLIQSLNNNSSNTEINLYSLIGKEIHIPMVIDAANPMDFQLVYRTELPNYADTDASWLEDEYLDLYTYTILKHTAPFLRNDERVAMWKDFAMDALASTLEEDKHSIEFGSPMFMQPSSLASSPVTRRNNNRG